MPGTISSSVETTPAARVAIEPQTKTSTGLVPSGIKPLDCRLRGILPDRPIVISGNAGTGKSVASLEFAIQGLERGETVVLISNDEAADVLASAAFLGIDIDRPLREGRLILLRYRSGFVRHLGQAANGDGVFDELRRHLANAAPGRIVIDSLVPFLDGGPGSKQAIQSLVRFLDEAKVTSLVTFPGDVTGLCDDRLEPLIQRAGGVFHLNVDHERNHRLEVRNLRYDTPTRAPVSFRILAGAGMDVLDDTDVPAQAALRETRPRLVLVNLADHLPNDLGNELRLNFDVGVQTSTVKAFADAAHDGTGALLLNVRRDVFESTLQLIRDLRRSNRAVPVVLVTPYVLRSADRTRALRAGADDFLSSGMAPADAVSRLRSIVCRGHWHDLMTLQADPGMLLQPMSGGSTYRPMPCDELTSGVRGYLDREAPPFFTLFVISTEKGDIGGLAKLALRIVRVESGDLVCVHGRKVIAYLDSARPKDLASLKLRLRDHALRLGYGDIEIEAFGFPANESAVRALLGAAAADSRPSMKKTTRLRMPMMGDRRT